MATTFDPERLAAGRALRGVTAASLAEKSGVSATWVSQVERSRREPSEDTVRSVARALGLPVAFFYSPAETLPPTEDFHFRATSRMAKKDESAARALALIGIELSDWISERYETPPPAVPEIQDLLGLDQCVPPEQAANALRDAWGLGVRPVGDLQKLLESHGVKIFSAGVPSKRVDAFSFRRGETPLVFLNMHKSAERIRFDLAHELGHLVMHGGSLAMAPGKEKEQAANEFAGAFLMPRAGLLGSLRGNMTVEDVIALKRDWKVSAMALNLRAHQIEMTSDWTYGLIAKQLSRAGFRSGEPGSALISEKSSLLTQVMSDLRLRRQGVRDIAEDLHVTPNDIRDLLLGLAVFAIPGGTDHSEKSRATLRVV